MTLQEIDATLKKSKMGYFARNVLLQLVPGSVFESQLHKKLGAIKYYDPNYLKDRVDYYNKLDTLTPLGPEALALKEINTFSKPRTYKFDAYELTRFFPSRLTASFLYGDVNHVAPSPTIQKSRPLWDDNKNAILLKLDKKRHYQFVKDSLAFNDKKNLLIGRGAMTQPHRIRFMEKYFNHPMCDLGQVNRQGGNTQWLKPKLSIPQHLKYKFILSLEGNDVATNLKWIMSSNSVAVMPPPTHETWFMEARLIPNHHYIAIKKDFSDLEEKLQYYIQHPAEAEAIARNANSYVQQFMDQRLEELLGLLVLEKYFYYTGQITTLSV
ncbi:glycosyltransferase family 90 protein [Mucilaginibacter sp. RS28]|uniref:Glycosyltransferase family 90 protein n=1 Tax=Mucilaginibacter straminoryzae TaxID=2932774 RepID=A0A9X1X1T8_9SPHI|nr:glycosyltransferase family 90 protein [Mucilaginibacter straminoryzae]MCJ8208435.1 glycosyltransferase family 90 protein [Mucilaginibacter straminoryzae]